MAPSQSFWLFKSDPEDFGWDDLERAPEQTTCWDGVRNYQARNFLRDSIKLGDRVLFYHSQSDPPALMGLCEVVREAYPDPTAWEVGHHHYDPKASPDNPPWVMVDIRLVERFPQPVPLERLRAEAVLEGLELLRKGSRLSIQPVSAEHFKKIMSIAGGGRKSAKTTKRG